MLQLLFIVIIADLVSQEATDVYKRLLLEHRDFVALNVYLALCYSKLDYFDVSSEILEGYLQQYADSAAAINLKACNLFKLYTGKAAEAEIKVDPPIIFLTLNLVALHLQIMDFVSLMMLSFPIMHICCLAL